MRLLLDCKNGAGVDAYTAGQCDEKKKTTREYERQRTLLKSRSLV